MISYIFYAIALTVVLAFVVSASRAAKNCSPLEVGASTPAPASNVVELSTPALRSCCESPSPPLSLCLLCPRLANLRSPQRLLLPEVKVRPLRHPRQRPRQRPRIRPPLHRPPRQGAPRRSNHSNTPHIPGAKCGLVYPDGSIKMVKHLGTFHPPTSVAPIRPRCKNLIHFKECFDCRRAPVERNTWLHGDILPASAVAIAKSTPVFQVPVASASRPRKMATTPPRHSPMQRTRFFT